MVNIFLSSETVSYVNEGHYKSLKAVRPVGSSSLTSIPGRGTKEHKMNVNITWKYITTEPQQSMVTMHECMAILQRTQYEHASSFFLFSLRKENLSAMYYRTFSKMVTSPLTPETPRRIIHGGGGHTTQPHTLCSGNQLGIFFAIDSHGDLSQNWLDTWKNRKYCSTLFLKSNARLNACLSKPFGKTSRKTTHKSWKEIWLSPHCLTQPSQLLNFSTAHMGALRWHLCCDVLNSSHRCGKALDISTHFDRKSKVGRTGETWVCGSEGWGIHSKSACYASS